MRIKDLRTSFINALAESYESQEVLSFFYILSEEILGMRRVDVAIHLDKKLLSHEIARFEEAEKRLKKYEPLQYIIGNTEFFGLSFLVNDNVLIPRPETEELVDWIVCDYKTHSRGLKVLDIGTGSGCIAISLAKNLSNVDVYAIDVSEKAIEIAKENAKRNNVAITFLEVDILNMVDLSQDFDIIVSNPPYVRELEKSEMKSNVLDNEPSLALFVSDKDPLVFYKKITDLAKKKLHTEGVLYFEINQYLGEETKAMIESFGFNSTILRKDVFGNDRMIKAYVN